MATANLFNENSFTISNDEIDAINLNLTPTSFPDGFQGAADNYVNNLDLRFTDDGLPKYQMAFDAKILRVLLADADAVMVTIGQDDFANFKICFQKIQKQPDNTFTIDTQNALSNYVEGDGVFPNGPDWPPH